MPLITTISELKKHIAIDANTDFATVEPFIEEAEELYIIPILGAAFYDALVSAYVDAENVVDDIVDANIKAIFPKVQKCIAYYMAYQSINQLGVNFGDSGINQSSSQNSQPAPGWKVSKLELSFIKQADLFAEKLLEYLEVNASVTVYNDWYASTANTKNEGYLVNNTRIASQYIDINDSRRLFLRLKKRIIQIEKEYVKALICTDQYDELVDQVKTDTITANSQVLIDMLRPIIAKKALFLTLPTIRVSVSEQGIAVYSSNDGVVQKQLAGKEEVKMLMSSLRDGEFGYIADEQKLKKFIEDNIADYPLIEASECWTSKADPGPKWQPENSADNKHFSV